MAVEFASKFKENGNVADIEAAITIKYIIFFATV